MMETYRGVVRSPADAIKLFEACRLGMLPRVQRRLSEKERQSIQSGSVFVWDEREAGMRRWTDGKSWSASRVSGSFLTYREMEGKRGGGFANTRRGGGKTPDSSGRGSDEDQDDQEPDGYRYKADGLMKQSFSITTSGGQHLHLISYYTRQQPGQPDLPQPSMDPMLRSIVPVKGMYPESSMNEAPMATMSRASIQQPPPPYVPPQHSPLQGLRGVGQAYPPYPQQPYAWPPSPMSTPPAYSHYAASAPYPQQTPLPPPPTGQYAPPPYGTAPLYDRAPLPAPPQMTPLRRASPPTSLAPYNPGPGHQPASPQLAYQRINEPIRPQHAQPPGHHGPLADPNNTMGSRLLPSISATTSLTRTPPQRALSASPTWSPQQDAHGPGKRSGNRASLSALLHPTRSSEPLGANPGGNSAENSPKQAVQPSINGGPAGPLSVPGMREEDARIKHLLNKNMKFSP